MRLPQIPFRRNDTRDEIDKPTLIRAVNAGLFLDETEEILKRAEAVRTLLQHGRLTASDIERAASHIGHVQRHMDGLLETVEEDRILSQLERSIERAEQFFALRQRELALGLQLQEFQGVPAPVVAPDVLPPTDAVSDAAAS